MFGSVFTTIYSLRFIYGAFARKGRPSRASGSPKCTVRQSTFLLAPAILAAAGLVFGVWPTGLDDVLDDYADTVPGGADYHLALWHGVNLPLLLSILVLAAAPRRSSASAGCAGCGSATLRSATPTASTTR